MKVDVTVRLYEKSNTKAFIVLKLDNTLIVKGLTLVEGKKGLFVSYPATKGKDGKYYNSVYSLDKEWREKLEDICIRKYKEAKKKHDNITEKGDDNITEKGDDFS